MFREPHQRSPFPPIIEDFNEHTTMQSENVCAKNKREMRPRISQNSRNFPGKCSNNLLTDIGIVLTFFLKHQSMTETQFVVNSGASTHVMSKKVLTEDEWDTIRVSRNPTTVTTANGSMDTDEEATEDVKYLEMFVTLQLLDDTPAVQALGKLCEEHWFSYE